VAQRTRHEDHAAGGRIFSALRYRNYRLFWLGQLVSVTGTFMQGTAQQWLVLTLSSNALDLGIVGALQFGPLLVLAPFGGAIADRWPRRVILMATQAVAGVLALALFLLTVTGVVQIWHVFALAGLLGVVNAVDMPTRQAFVSEMVPPESLLNAVSLNSAQFNASRIVGPGLAGAMIALLGMPILFFLNAFSFIAVIAGLLMMRPAELLPVPHADQGHGLGRLRAMSEGARFVLRTPVVAVTFIMVAVVGIFGFNFNVLLPLEATQGLHAGPALFGLLTSSLGVGALMGALLLARRRGQPTNRLLVGMALTFGILETGIALTRSVPAAMVLFAATGFFMSSFSAAANTRVQLASPPELRGRVMSVYMMVFAGTTPIGNLLTSGVAGSAGVAMSFVVSGVPCVLAALLSAWLWRAPRRVAQPAPALAALPLNPLPASERGQGERSMALPARRSLPPHQPRPAPGNPIPQPRAAAEPR
jgi:MFS family permease